MKIFNKINLAAEIIKHSEASMEDLQELRLIPLITFVLSAIIATFTVFLLVFVWSAGSEKEGPTNPDFPDLIDGNRVKYLEQNVPMMYVYSVFYIFMFLMWKGIIVSTTEMIFMQTICTWYFTKRKATLVVPLTFPKFNFSSFQ